MISKVSDKSKVSPLVGRYVVFAQASPSVLRNPHPLPRGMGSRGRVYHPMANDHHLTFAQARAAIADYRAAHNVSAPMWSAERYLRHWKELAPLHTIDRIVFRRKTS